MDPPYGTGLAQAALDRAADWLAAGGWLSIEVSGEGLRLPARVEEAAERRYGKARLHILRRRPEA
jgi:16S rRNA G966 N2-methylase RsmD